MCRHLCLATMSSSSYSPKPTASLLVSGFLSIDSDTRHFRPSAQLWLHTPDERLIIIHWQPRPSNFLPSWHLPGVASTLCSSDWTIPIVIAEGNLHELFQSFFYLCWQGMAVLIRGCSVIQPSLSGFSTDQAVASRSSFLPFLPSSLPSLPSSLMQTSHKSSLSTEKHQAFLLDFLVFHFPVFYKMTLCVPKLRENEKFAHKSQK